MRVCVCVRVCVWGESVCGVCVLCGVCVCLLLSVAYGRKIVLTDLHGESVCV